MRNLGAAFPRFWLHSIKYFEIYLALWGSPEFTGRYYIKVQVWIFLPHRLYEVEYWTNLSHQATLTAMLLTNFNTGLLKELRLIA